MNGLPATPVFDDGKAADALRTIGEVAQALGIRQHVLRYWEEQFPALQPIKRSGGRRYYRPQDVALIVEIDRLVHREGFTLRGACKALSGKPAVSTVTGDMVPDAGSRGMRDQLVTIRRELAEALAAA
ncbi:MerR family transcriptional regulator [Novosphingobium album (ex Hu et al. 2023)]|uniref:MerR family transcriptional regulator n=1 Tax=Novosphingobium album (ex Hu et al. 2023) TaxID=2930093 RepID=A0ABT0AYP2_9SPHN|nr:MerR family transcriptional regulator [Novosphingobium album (ex Hu et al. 2023)]MCJ2177905.1 MerR family transcriptional regulator [Novosphingobium album (ex Hu et al. 2023)]